MSVENSSLHKEVQTLFKLVIFSKVIIKKIMHCLQWTTV